MINGDRPISKPEDDVLGFSEMATWLATAAVSRELADGFVVGVEGAWGSGKSSLINLARHQWEAMDDACKPVIVDFSPWLVGERDALLLSLFDDLRRKIDGIEYEEGDATGISATKVTDTVETLKKYGRRASSLHHLTALAANAGIPLVGLATEPLKALAELKPEDKSTESALDIKLKLDGLLADIGRRIIVVIDDLDRLEPKEIMEILRLVRAVADFKNVTYILCYDNGIISTAVNTAIGISDQNRFLEKIIQLEIKVPPVNSFAMTALFRKQLDEIIECSDVSSRERMWRVVQHWGSRYLTTPRMINKVLDSIRFGWPYLKDKIDGPDYVWLQLIRFGNPDYYGWATDYLHTSAAHEAGRVSLSNDQQERKNHSFSEIISLESKEIDISREVFELKFILPHVTKKYNSSKNSFYIMNNKFSSSANRKRLSSSLNYRLYVSGYTVENADIEITYESLVTACNSSRRFVTRLIHQAINSGQLLNLNTVLSRLAPGTELDLTENQLRTLIEGLAIMMDRRKMFIHDQSILMLLGAYSDRIRDDELLNISPSDINAISWFAMLLRREEDIKIQIQEENQNIRLMSEKSLRNIKDAVIYNIADETSENLIFRPRFHFLFEMIINRKNGYGRNDSIDQTRNFIVQLSDEKFIKFLENVVESGPNRGMITRKIDPFLDFDFAYKRISEMIRQSDQPTELNERAKALLGSFKD